MAEFIRFETFRNYLILKFCSNLKILSILLISVLRTLSNLEELEILRNVEIVLFLENFPDSEICTKLILKIKQI